METSKDTTYKLIVDPSLTTQETLPLSYARHQRISRYVIGLYVLLFSSLGCNLFLLTHKRIVEVEKASAFAGLTFDTYMPDDRGDPYNSQNQSLAEQAWSEIPWDAGEIVLDHEYAARQGLPPAQPWVWDGSKGVYFINAHHGLHCLQLMRRTYMELLTQQPPSYDSEHILHCFNALRQDIMCNADDTPRYTGFEHPGTVGYGQPRVCRSWEKLQEWATERSACWRDINPTEGISELLRFRYCPAGPKWDAVRDRIESIWGHVEQGKGASKDT